MNDPRVNRISVAFNVALFHHHKLKHSNRVIPSSAANRSYFHQYFSARATPTRSV